MLLGQVRLLPCRYVQFPGYRTMFNSDRHPSGGGNDSEPKGG
jgi:hypothetical protein